MNVDAGKVARTKRMPRWFGLWIPLTIILLVLLSAMTGPRPTVDDLDRLALVFFMTGVIVGHLGRSVVPGVDAGSTVVTQTTASVVAWNILLFLGGVTFAVQAWVQDDLFGKVLWTAFVPMSMVLLLLELRRRATRAS